MGRRVNADERQGGQLGSGSNLEFLMAHRPLEVLENSNVIFGTAITSSFVVFEIVHRLHRFPQIFGRRPGPARAVILSGAPKETRGRRAAEEPRGTPATAPPYPCVIGNGVPPVKRQAERLERLPAGCPSNSNGVFIIQPKVAASAATLGYQSQSGQP